MSESFVADTQYGDLVGTAAFDGHSSLPLHEIARRLKIPGGYWPIGFEIHAFPDEVTGNTFPVSVVAVRPADVGTTPDEFISSARETQEIDVYRFSGRLKPQDMNAFFKRVDIKVVQREFAQCEMRVHEGEQE